MCRTSLPYSEEIGFQGSDCEDLEQGTNTQIPVLLHV